MFFLSTKIFTHFSNLAVCPCEVTWTEAPPTIVWLTEAFQHSRLRWCLTSDPPWVSCHQFHRQSRCRQEWLLSDWGVLLLDVIMNIAVVIYSHHLSGWRGLLLVLKGKRPWYTEMRICSRKSFVIQLRQQKWVQGFLNESLQIAFHNNVLISKFQDECG